MFSLLGDDESAVPIAKISTGKYKGQKIFLVRSENIDPARMTVDLGKDKLIPYVNTKGRLITYISGPAGSGKSTIAGEIAMTFKKQYPDKDIYIFSRKDSNEDPAYCKLKPIQIRIDKSMVEKPIDISDFQKGSLVIFDDIGTIHDKDIEYEVEHVANELMQVGRYLGIHMLITTHITNANKPFYQALMIELHNYIFFPSSGATKPIRNCLSRYFEMDNKDIKKILQLNKNEDFAWTMFKRTNPQILMHSHGIHMLNSFLGSE